MFRQSPLHPRYGLCIQDVQLSEISRENGYKEIRQAFEEYSLLYFPNQNVDDDQHLTFSSLFGPREDRTIHSQNPDPTISLVSNVRADNTLLKRDDKKLLDLQSNMLWHTDSTFLPVPALTNILIGRVIPPSGTATEFASTRIAWEDMPEKLRQQARDVYFKHDYSHSRRKVDPELALSERFTHWGQQIWKSVWTNPVNHREALYIASHACGAMDMPESEALELIDTLIQWCGRQEYVYSHQWAEGDVVVWDERAMLHRGTPWDYDEPRVLSSICVSAILSDGLDTMRYYG